MVAMQGTHVTVCLLMLLAQASPHVQFALALSSCLAATNYARLLRLLEGAPLLLAAAGQVRRTHHRVAHGAGSHSRVPVMLGPWIHQLQQHEYVHASTFPAISQLRRSRQLASSELKVAA